LLGQREALREQVREIEEKLRPYSLSIPKGYGKQTAERVEGLVERLNKAIAEAEMRVAMLQEETIEQVDAMLQGAG
jgi:DNA repair exonuclease SbcCD ATPase subunit